MAFSSPSSPQDFGYPLMLEDYITVPHPTTSTSLCTTCHTPTKTRCSTCKNIRYCSLACQTWEWLLHKRVCKRYIASLSQRPDQASRRILFFSTDDNKPVFSYLSFKGNDATPEGLSTFFPDVPVQETKKLSFHNKYLPYFVQLTYDTNPGGKRVLLENKSLGLPFRGPVVMMAFDPQVGMSAPPLDADTTVMAALTEYVLLWKEYKGPVFIEQPQERYGEEELRKILGKRGV